jgi:hypothetical protein
MTPNDLAAKGLRVKPLVWVFWTRGETAGADAVSVVGKYRIRSHPKHGEHKLFLGTELLQMGDYTDLKPAAQADHAARVAEMIEATESVAQVLGQLADRQQRLGPDFEAAIFSDLDGLYEK